MLRFLVFLPFFSILLLGCHGSIHDADKKVALQKCKAWQAAGRTVNVKILSFHSAAEGYSFQFFSRECVHDEDSRKIIGFIYPLVESGDFENKYSQISFRNFLEVASAKGPSRIAKNFLY